jgi:hypothetical protein
MEQIKSPKICEVCGKPYEYALTVHYNKDGTKTCEHDNPSAGPSKVDARRKENAAASAIARQQAAEYAGSRPREEMVTINPPKGDTGKKPEVVPKIVVDSIQQKINQKE